MGVTRGRHAQERDMAARLARAAAEKAADEARFAAEVERWDRAKAEAAEAASRKQERILMGTARARVRVRAAGVVVVVAWRRDAAGGGGRAERSLVDVGEDDTEEEKSARERARASLASYKGTVWDACRADDRDTLKAFFMVEVCRCCCCCRRCCC